MKGHVILCSMSDGKTYRIEVDGRPILFEMHRYCGPCAVKADGSERKLGTRKEHRLLVTVDEWIKRGRHVGPKDGDVTPCILN